MEVNRAFKGVWIPKEIWLDENLSLREKCFLVEIDSLDCSDQGCFASNAHFAKFSGLSKSRCSEIINSLEEKGYIRIELKYKEDSKQIEKRVIKTVHKYFGYSENRTSRYSENPDRGSENTKDSNTINNTNNKYNYQEVIDYLNEKTGKSYKAVKTNNQHINARYEEGYTLEDFKAVIDLKTSQWKGNPKMEPYLRPSTLFCAKNFENYVNEAPRRSIECTSKEEVGEFTNFLDMVKRGGLDE